MADVENPEGTPTPEPTETPIPSDAPPASPPPAEAPPAGEPAEEPPATEARRAVDDRVPYPRFRQVQTEATQYRRTLAQQRAEYDQLRGRAGALEEQLRQRDEELGDHRALAEIVRSDPDLYETVRSRIETHTRAGGGRPAPAPAQRSPTNGEPEWLSAVRENNQFIREERARLQAEREQTHKERLYSTVHGQVSGLLKQHGYSQNVEKLTPRVIDFIVARGEAMFDDTGTVEDVPWLFNQWLEGQSLAEQARATERIAAHKADAARPAPVPANVMPPAGAKPFAVGDARIREQAAKVLREAGWRDAAA